MLDVTDIYLRDSSRELEPNAYFPIWNGNWHLPEWFIQRTGTESVCSDV